MFSSFVDRVGGEEGWIDKQVNTMRLWSKHPTMGSIHKKHLFSIFVLVTERKDLQGTS